MAEGIPSNSFRSAMKVVNGDLVVDMETLRELVEAHPNDAVQVTYRLLANLELPGTVQSAVAFGRAYQEVFHDDSLAERVAQALEQAGIDPPELQRPRSAEPPSATPHSTERPLVVLKVSASLLAECSVSPLIRKLGMGFTPPETLRSLAGCCYLSFEVEREGRPSVVIPEIRRYVRAIDEQLPGFPYYLHFHPRTGSFVTYFGCLADEEALANDGKALNVAHPSVISAVARSIRQSNRHARLIGDPNPSVGGALLASLPTEAAARVVLEMTGLFEGA